MYAMEANEQEICRSVRLSAATQFLHWRKSGENNGETRIVNRQLLSLCQPVNRCVWTCLAFVVVHAVAWSGTSASHWVWETWMVYRGPAWCFSGRSNGMAAVAHSQRGRLGALPRTIFEV